LEEVGNAEKEKTWKRGCSSRRRDVKIRHV
jgi:hypothetical protein